METYPEFHGRPLFSFGTLQDEDVFHVIAGSPLREPARTVEGLIEDHAACGVLGGLYPVLVRRHGAVARGTLFHDLPSSVLDRLIWFEWPEFVPEVIDVVTDDGKVESTYFRPAKTPPVSDETWSLQDWRHNRKADWLGHARTAMHFHGVMSSRELDRHWEDISRYVAGQKVDLPPDIAARCDLLRGGVK